MVYERLQQKLRKRREQGNLRKLRPCNNLIDFTSNDYLGFTRSESLKKAIANELLNVCEGGTGCGSTGSRLLTGNHTYCEELEKSIARFHGAAEGVIFNTGYLANFGLITAIVQPDDTVIYDTQIHASIHSGLQSCKAKILPFRHNDLNHLEERLKKGQGKIFVCVESIYSIDGTIAPLQSIANLCDTYGTHLIVDEAHATGIIGENGEGYVHALGLQDRVFARVHTFGKALGAHGGIVLGNEVLKEYLINFSIPFIYTTALPLHNLAAIKCAYAMLPQAKLERMQLSKLLEYCQKQESPIIPLAVEGNEKAKKAVDLLEAEGFDVRAIMSPTVRRGHECLRLCLHSYNSIEQLSSLIKCLEKQGICIQ